jgi:hypothetical protein
MSNGFLIAAAADLAAAHELADGFGLDVIDASADHEATIAALANAANVGLILSVGAARDAAFTGLVNRIASRLERAQLIIVEPEARDAFSALPAAWPTMSFSDAQTRAHELVRRRDAEAPPAEDNERAHPLPPATEAPPELDGAPLEQESEQQQEQQQQQQSEEPLDDQLAGGPLPSHDDEAPREDQFAAEAPAEEAAPPADDAPPEPQAPAPEASEPPPAPVQAGPPPAEPPAAPPSVSEPEAPPQPAPVPAGPPIRERRERAIETAPSEGATETPRTESGAAVDMHSATRSTPGADRLGETAPADATAFAPSKLRRGEPELVRIAVHQPKDLNAVIKAAKKIDPRTEPAPQGMPIGNIALGASIGVALEVRGATCDGALQRRRWTGEPIDFNFAVEADASVKQVVMLARVFVDDAQIGVLAFTRKVSGPAKKPHGPGDRARLKRHKRVFLSYSSQDRETVSAIATAYQMAGVDHFWDRASLKSGEEWHPRLRREIDRADLFHLCWSKNAAQSEWVQKEAEHALTRRRKHSGKPDITVQMLDGPPWAAHPAELDSINFDDFVRAAIVGYARGDGS